MHDKAFTFQTLRPDTIIDGLFDLGMRVDSGLTPLNSYENRVYQFHMPLRLLKYTVSI